MPRRLLVGLLAVVAAAGCHVGPRYRVPKAAVRNESCVMSIDTATVMPQTELDNRPSGTSE